ncbi:hypothetical protein DICVIV_04429 [Dictyocaulus viviparus]|uniref:Uncharacterized protein n=1 Tax=Dictyocaulus viviparus TaxID=29172 RepID=A0A0D8Y060_DICVI|nr:hypothetical protein DICVIV_04429 [Dictyocaulus viviparus]
MAYLIVDDIHNQVPPLYVNSLNDKVQLMHTNASIQLSNHPQRQHLRNFKLNADAMQISRESKGYDTDQKSHVPHRMFIENEEVIRLGSKHYLISEQDSELSMADKNLIANGAREKS